MQSVADSLITVRISLALKDFPRLIKKILSNKLDLPLPFSPKIKFPFLQGNKDVPNKFLTFEILSWVICILDR